MQWLGREEWVKSEQLNERERSVPVAAAVDVKDAPWLEVGDPDAAEPLLEARVALAVDGAVDSAQEAEEGTSTPTL